MSTVYGVKDWNHRRSTCDPNPPLQPRIFLFRFHDVDVKESWMISTLMREPAVPRFLNIPSVFISDAREIEAKPMLCGIQI